MPIEKVKIPKDCGRSRSSPRLDRQISAPLSRVEHGHAVLSIGSEWPVHLPINNPRPTLHLLGHFTDRSGTQFSPLTGLLSTRYCQLRPIGQANLQESAGNFHPSPSLHGSLVPSCVNNAMSGNTMRGTPGRGQGRGAIPFTGSPATSNIPRPVLETAHSSHAGTSSEAGGSSVSASRQKQSKRDEVCPHIQ